ncbi:imelysin family protein [Acuticoccus sp. M5D2P5]|uniref:imelysin family protein n=1 Tax=Acuticoccus kalidii TaxID=2910977 RepID=UPI001F2356AB|nr:imelysin family protein [Acuticoccus kalidii]MCF3933517.1 imelysin family protein [Acuticoccus kalidii]
MIRPLLAGAAILAASLAPATAQTETARTPVAFAPAVEALIDEVIVPAHAAFTVTADEAETATAALCAAPSAETLAMARTAFGELVLAFSRVELYRFGPARDENRYERLFFWPDRRSRGLHQIQGLIASEDESATSLDTLTQKSVAVQGLPALEFALFGTDSDALTHEAGFRCRYAETVATAIAGVAASIEDGWRTSFRETMMTAGPDNPVYRSHGEAFQDIVQAGAEELQLLGDIKIGAVIGDEPGDGNAKSAPFWRSGLTLPSYAANVEGVRALVIEPLRTLLGDDYNLADSILFEFAQVDRAFGPLLIDPRPWTELAEDPDAHRRLTYARSPMRSAQTFLGQRIPGALGLIVGFNSMDGD